VSKVVLTILEAGRDFCREREPCLDFETRLWSYRPFKDRVREAGILTHPGAQSRECGLVVQELDDIEFDQIPEQR
jgi:hypothetical protein